MEIIRTDCSCETERLILLRQMCTFRGYSISKLKDNKGTLTVYWKSKPNLYDMENVSNVWRFLSEFNTKHVFKKNI